MLLAHPGTVNNPTYEENVSQLPPARLSLTPSRVSDPFLYTSIANQAAGSHGWYIVFPGGGESPAKRGGVSGGYRGGQPAHDKSR